MEAIIEAIVNPHLEELKKRKEDKWHNSKYGAVKAAAMTPKGDFGEDVTTDLIKTIIGVFAERKNKGKGEFDIFAALSESGITFENKLATEDTNGGYQFNGFKKTVKFDYGFCLGVSPNDMCFGIFPKSVIDDLTVSMTKDGEDSFKLTARLGKGRYALTPLTVENFKKEIAKIV